MDQSTAMWILGVAIAAIGALLQNKDSAQAKQIALLFIKHDEDAAALQLLRERIAGNHYERQTIDARFEKFEISLKDGFADLGSKLEKLTETVTQYRLNSKGDQP